MPTRAPAATAFPYVRHACPPEGDLRSTTLWSFVAVPCGLLSLHFAWNIYPETVKPYGSWAFIGEGTPIVFGAIGLILLLVPLIALFDLGVVDVVPNRVSVRNGATVVRREILSTSVVVGLPILMLVGVVGFANTFMESRFSIERAGVAGLVMGPGYLALCAAGVGMYFWGLFRRIRMTPEYLVYTRGLRTVVIRWDEIGDVITANDVRGHEERRKHTDRYEPGAKIAIPEQIAEATELPVWRDGDTPRLRLEAEGYRVEASSLLTVILAMRDHPELRAELGTKASKRFFFRPPFRVRKEMYRTQVWWPAGSAPAGVAVDKNGVVEEAR